MDNVPIEQVQAAKLPQAYESAKQALETCVRIDECQQWADKASALASYAKQAQDMTLQHHAQRIQARAIRRAGELLKQVEPQNKSGINQYSEPREGDHPRLTRTQAATEAGMSDHQRKQALRVATVPEPEFSAQVDSDNPPTVTQLAEQGKQRIQPQKSDMDAAIDAVGALRRFVQESEKYSPERAAAGLMPNQIQKTRALIAKADAWLDKFAVNLETQSYE